MLEYCKTISYFDIDLFKAANHAGKRFTTELIAPFKPAEIEELKALNIPLTRRVILDLVEERLKEGKTLYIHKGKIKCLRDSHDVISVEATVPTIRGYKKQISINVSYCIDCDQMFIHKNEYDLYQRDGIIPLIRMTYVNKRDGSFDVDKQLASESTLKLLGYNVGQKEGLSSVRRHGILSDIMSAGLMTKTEILNHIDFLLSMNAGRPDFRLALEKWEEDLQFVMGYNIEKQIKGKVKEIKQYGK